jgi:hypothetical protein
MSHSELSHILYITKTGVKKEIERTAYKFVCYLGMCGSGFNRYGEDILLSYSFKIAFIYIKLNFYFEGGDPSATNHFYE